jgi:hypothetical protein
VVSPTFIFEGDYMNHSRWRYFGFLLLALLALSFSIIQNIATNKIQAAEPRDFNETMLPRDSWLEYGREMARMYGITGEVQREEVAVMTYGSYLVLTEQDQNSSLMQREALVVVYQAFGEIPKLEGFGSAGGRSDIQGFTFAYEAQTGFNLAHG